MVIHDFNVNRPARCPAEAHAVLIIDPNAILPKTISGKFFQTVARGDTHFTQPDGGVELVEFTCRNPPQRARADASSGSRRPTVEHILGTRISECPDHYGIS